MDWSRVEKLPEVVAGLASWFVGQARNVDQLSPGDQCHLLLCASDLGVESATLRNQVDTLVSRMRIAAPAQVPLITAMMHQLVFVKFDAGQAERQRFVDYWLNENRAGGQSLAAVSFLVEIGLENLDLLTEKAAEYVRGWHHRHHDLRSDRVAAWAPYYLKKLGYPEAEERAREVLGRRLKDGSWDHEVRRTIACAYALSMYGIPGADLLPTVRYIVSRFEQDLVEDAGSRAQGLKLLHKLNAVPEATLQQIKDDLAPSKLFVSYARADKIFIDDVVDRLRAAGVEPWMDVLEIAAGEEFPNRLADAINRCDAVLAAVSKDALQSPYFMKEVLYAINRRKPIIAIELGAAELPDQVQLMLADAQRVRAGDLAAQAIAGEIVRGLKRLGLS